MCTDIYSMLAKIKRHIFHEANKPQQKCLIQHSLSVKFGTATQA
jgi:hypothetical protein